MANSEKPQSEITTEQQPQSQTLETKPEHETLPSTEAQRVSESQHSLESSGANVEVSSPLPEPEEGGAEGSGKTLEDADQLMEKGSVALKEGDYAEAVDSFSRAVEIRAGHYGELAPECSSAYYKYGCALLYKAQEETDPLGSVPKKEVSSQENLAIHGNGRKRECSATSVADAKKDEDSAQNDGESNDGASKKDQVEADDNSDDSDNEASDGDDLVEPDEDDSDLDLAWKMLDVARAIVEKNPHDTMEKVDILSALGEVALEREDIESSYSDYTKALSILERLVEPDSRYKAELNFRICLVLELGSKLEDAVIYCKNAISICKCRVERLTDEVQSSTVSAATVDGENQKAIQPPGGSDADSSVLVKEAEIKTLTDLSGDLERKLEDLQHQVLHPTSVLPEVLKMISAKASGNPNGTSASSSLDSTQMATINGGGLSNSDSSTVFSTANTKVNTDGPVQHLGVVGRGVKRVTMSSNTEESSVTKKHVVEKGDGSS